MKHIALLLALALCIAVVTPSATAHDNTDILYDPPSISAEEQQSVQLEMSIRGLHGNVKTEALYDNHKNPAFILGYSGSGYLIIDRKSGICIESGDLNPYRDYLDFVKYYGGVLEYYVNDSLSSTKFFSLYHEDYVDAIPEVNIAPNIEPNSQNYTSENAIKSVTSSSVPVILKNADIHLRRRAFGFNNDDTCSAVACTLALNYIAVQGLNSNVVPSEYRLDLLTKTVGADEVATTYPHSNAFHRLLTNTCSMGPVSFGNGIVSGIDNYRNLRPTISATGISTQHLFVTQDTIIQEIDAGRPCLITTTIFAGEYNFHTMVVYGYKELINGVYEFLVHTGWYKNVDNSYPDRSFRIAETWMMFSVGTNFLYKFQYN